MRFPDGMRDRIAEAAKANNRSMNAEIVARLEASLNSAAPGADAWTQVARIEAEYSAADMFMRGVKQQLEQAHAELEHQKASGARDNVIKATQAMIELLVPLQHKAFDEWLMLGDRLRLAKYQAMGLNPRGSAVDNVARRLYGPEWDDMPLPPPMSPPSAAADSAGDAPVTVMNQAPAPSTADDLRRELNDPEAERASTRQVVDEFIAERRGQRGRRAVEETPPPAVGLLAEGPAESEHQLRRLVATKRGAKPK